MEIKSVEFKGVQLIFMIYCDQSTALTFLETFQVFYCP